MGESHFIIKLSNDLVYIQNEIEDFSITFRKMCKNSFMLTYVDINDMFDISNDRAFFKELLLKRWNLDLNEIEDYF